MSNAKEYVAIQDFSLNLDNGKSTEYVSVGDRLTFDGLYVTFKDKSGTARPLAKVIGEWIKLADSGEVRVRAATTPSTPSRNVTGGKIVEHSDFPSDPINRPNRVPNDNLQNLVEQSERMPEVKMSQGKREVTSDLDDLKKEVTVINSDDDEVMKVTTPTHDASTKANKRGVEIGEDAAEKVDVVSMEESVVKETNYSDGKETTMEVKRAKLDYDASGVEVKKTATNKKASTKKEVTTEVPDETVVAKVSQPAIQETDVGSSTQADVEALKDPPKKTIKKTTRKKATRKNTKRAKEVISTDGQEAEVVGKVKRDSDPVETAEGITSKVTVGASEDSGDSGVVFSKTDDFDESTVTATVGSSDLDIDANDIVDSVSDFEADDIIPNLSDDDIDVNDLLSDI